MKALEDPKIIESLSQKRTYRNEGCWESGYAYLYESIRAYEDLAAVLIDHDANTLIFTMENIVPSLVELLSPTQKRDLQSKLREHLKDKRMCEIPSNCSQADEEDTTTVREAANYALKLLEEN